MNGLVWLAVLLFIVWLAGVAIFKVVGFAIHVALVAALVLLIIWAFRKLGGSSGGSTASR